MSSTIRSLSILAILLTFAATGYAQIAAICGESGSTPWMNTSYVYGKVQLKGFDLTKLPKITVVLADRRGSESRYTIDRSGNYCFRNTDGSGGFLVIEVEGLEVVRRSLPSGGSGPVQHRQDFEIQPTHPEKSSPPAAISAKYNYPRRARNNKLLDQAVQAEREMELGKAAQFLLIQKRYDDAITTLEKARQRLTRLPPGRFNSWEKPTSLPGRVPWAWSH